MAPGLPCCGSAVLLRHPPWLLCRSQVSRLPAMHCVCWQSRESFHESFLWPTRRAWGPFSVPLGNRLAVDTEARARPRGCGDKFRPELTRAPALGASAGLCCHVRGAEELGLHRGEGLARRGNGAKRKGCARASPAFGKVGEEARTRAGRAQATRLSLGLHMRGDTPGSKPTGSCRVKKHLEETRSE